AVLKEDPKLSELHLPEVFEREEIEGDSAKPGTFVLHDLLVPLVQDPDLDPFLSTGIELRRGTEVIAKLTPDSPEAALDDKAEVLTFTIRSLPVGDYQLFTTVEDVSNLIATGIQVRKKGIFF